MIAFIIFIFLLFIAIAVGVIFSEDSLKEGVAIGVGETLLLILLVVLIINYKMPEENIKTINDIKDLKVDTTFIMKNNNIDTLYTITYPIN